MGLDGFDQFGLDLLEIGGHAKSAVIHVAPGTASDLG